MASKASNVIAQVLGGTKKVLDGVGTVGEVRAKLGLSATYAASKNGDPARDSDSVDCHDFISFSEAVKGA